MVISEIEVRGRGAEENDSSNGLKPEELAFLRDGGYEVLEKVGEGKTREAYLARYNRGEVDKLRVIKIPKHEVDSDSVCSLINRSKGDLDLEEVLLSNLIQHPNIAEVVDNFRLDGRTVNVEAYYQGADLEASVKNLGPIRDEEKLNRILSQIIGALTYLNCRKGILHRDIKPSNILVTPEGDVKITDLQNAARRRDIRDLSMPTRGGTPYTHPDLLNALVSGDVSSATQRTEVYAFGATLFYMLTGQNPFDYNIVADDNGKEINVGEKKFRIKLKAGGRDLEGITREEHEARLKQSLGQIPRKYRDLVYRCLTTEFRKGFYDMEGVKRAFDGISANFYQRIREAVVRGAKITLPVFAAGAVTALAIIGGINAAKQEPKPTMAEIMRQEDYREFSLETLEGLDKNYALDILVPYMEKARKRLPGLEQEQGKNEWKLSDYLDFAERTHLMNRRLVSAWLRACLLNKDIGKRYEKYGKNRFDVSYVPQNFVFRNSSSGSYRPEEYEAPQQVAQGVMYLKQCLGPNRNVAEVFAEYFSSNETINTARVRTKSISYLPRVVPSEGNPNVGSIEMGYFHFMPYYEQELINTAVALYLITDEKGNIDWSKIPRLDFPPGQYKNMLSLPQ